MSESALWQCTICGRHNNATHTVCAPCGTPRSYGGGVAELAVTPYSTWDFNLYDFPVWSFVGVGVATTMVMLLTIFFSMIGGGNQGYTTTFDWIVGITLVFVSISYPLFGFVMGVFHTLRLGQAYPAHKDLLRMGMFMLYIPVMGFAAYLWMRAMWWDSPTTWLDLSAALFLNAVGPTAIAAFTLFLSKRFLAWEARREDSF